jgi:hypothetical protein
MTKIKGERGSPWWIPKDGENVLEGTPLTKCYEENISMARGKPQQMKMTAEIKSNPRYAI